MDVISWDLDSTLVDTRHRQHLILDDREATDWVAYSMACPQDTIGPAWGMFEALRYSTDLGHIAVTRRNHEALALTRAWFRDQAADVFEAVLMLGGPHSTPEREHGLWKCRQIINWEERTGNRVILHVDDAPIGPQFEEARIPFLQVVSPGSEFITKPKLPVG